MTQTGSIGNSTITVQQVRAARGLLGWSQTELARRAGLSRETVKRFEAPSDLNVSSEARAKLQQALEEGGVEFIQGNGGGPGVRLKKWRPKASR
jgi:transcriptional regulator with XRE-family HTH domain